MYSGLNTSHNVSDVTTSAGVSSSSSDVNDKSINATTSSSSSDVKDVSTNAAMSSLSGEDQQSIDNMPQNETTDTSGNSSASSRAKWFYCTFPQCNRICKGEWALGKHYEFHTNPKPFICNWPDCGQNFTKILHLRIHESNAHNIEIDDSEIENEAQDYEALLNSRLESSKMLLGNVQKRLKRLHQRRDYEMRECAQALTEALVILKSKGVREIPPDVEATLKKITRSVKVRQSALNSTSTSSS